MKRFPYQSDNHFEHAVRSEEAIHHTNSPGRRPRWPARFLEHLFGMGTPREWLSDGVGLALFFVLFFLLWRLLG
jgi:hypothetical protein